MTRRNVRPRPMTVQSRSAAGSPIHRPVSELRLRLGSRTELTL